MGAKVYVVTVGGRSEEDVELVGGASERIIHLDQWRGVDSDQLGSIADRICKDVPEASREGGGALTWPARKASPTPIPAGRACSVVDYEVDLIIVLDSSNFDEEDYAKIIEGVSVLVDESFDLAPDVVRIGFIVYSDQVSVPVALAHYQDKVELLSKIGDSTRLSGTAIALRGLDAARQQFQLHGRGVAVPKVILLITNGKHRGNAANAAQTLREDEGMQIFAVAVNPSPEQYASLSRIVGTDYVDTRLIKLSSAEEMVTGEKLSFIKQALCGRINLAAGYIAGPTDSTQMRMHRTVKRAVVTEEVEATTPTASPSLCSDGFVRPYLISVLIDTTEGVGEESFNATLGHLKAFLLDKFGVSTEDEQRVRLNLMTVDHAGVNESRAVDASVLEFTEALAELKQRGAGPPQWAAGIQRAIRMAEEQHIGGVNKVLLIISADGSGGGDTNDNHIAFPSTNIIAVSIAQPVSDMLQRLAGGSPTQVIHFADWQAPAVHQQFPRWLSYAICEGVMGSTTTTSGLLKHTLPSSSTTRLPKWRRAGRVESTAPENPSNVVVHPLSPTSLSVSWTCCTNTQAVYALLYTPDARLPIDKWKRVEGLRCRDSFGVVISNLPTSNTYKACVVVVVGGGSEGGGSSTPPLTPNDNCDELHLGGGEGRRLKDCPPGYEWVEGECTDVDECGVENGRCSHGCVNTHGDYYCACPHGLMLDPLDSKVCIKVGGSFDRIAALLARYNTHSDEQEEEVTTIHSEEGNETSNGEWPARMKKALSWLI